MCFLFSAALGTEVAQLRSPLLHHTHAAVCCRAACALQLPPWEGRNGAAVDYAMQRLVQAHGKDDEVRPLCLSCSQLH